MQKFRVPINSFQYGEVSDSLTMRTDSPVYAASAKSLENMIVLAEGSVKKRDGLKHRYKYPSITYNPAHPAQSHLFKFAFSDDEEYLISVEHERVRCFYLDSDTTITLVSTITQDTNASALPFDQDYLNQYTFAQYGDVMFICHPLFMPRMLIRTSLTSFEITPYSFDERLDGSLIFQPYSVFQANGVTLDPSASTGSGITLTTSAPHWVSGHVGAVVRYNESEIVITSITSSTVAVGNVIDTLRVRLSVLNPFRTTDGSATVEVTHIKHGYAGGETVVIEGASAVGGINTGNLNGTRTVAGIIDENTWYFNAGGSASSAEDGGGYVKLVTHAPTADWSEQSFSAVRGYPAAVAFHENRLCFGGTLAEPDALWFSKIGQFFNFDLGDAADDDAISLVAATGSVNEIRYIISNRDLQIFGAAGELYVPTYLNQAITPSNAQIRMQTPYGCEFTQPVSIDGATIFVQHGGHTVREYLYTDNEQAYTSTAVSTISSHLIASPKCMTVSHGVFRGAESYAFMSNGNGDIALFNSNRAERRASWTRLTTDGNFCSVCGIGERVFVNIWAPDGSMNLCEFTGEIGLDRYVTATISADYADVSSAFSVGDVVHVLNEGGTQYYGEYTVVDSSGVAKVLLTGYTGTVNVGVKFNAVVQTNAVDANTGIGPMTGGIRGIVMATVDMKSTRSIKVNTRSATLDQAFSGKKEFRLLGYSKDPTVTVSQNEPLPMQVNGLIAEVIV